MTVVAAIDAVGDVTKRARQSSMMMPSLPLARRGKEACWSMGLARTVLPGDILNIKERFLPVDPMKRSISFKGL